MTAKPTLYMTYGLPASGKSTWASEFVLSKPAGAVIRVNKDTLREMLHAGRWKGNKTEGQIVKARDALIALGLSLGKDVIVDDTNLDPSHHARLDELAAEHGADLVIRDFTDVDVKTCIERDLKRPASVGHKVINKMHMKYLATAFAPPVYDPSLPDAIIVDIDGTLAHMSGRSPYDYTLVKTDTVDTVVRTLLMREFKVGTKIIILSGRKEACYRDTLEWLDDNDIPHHEMWMRGDGDDRDDAIIKGEIYEAFVEGQYNVAYVLDDRDRVVAMWRARGLKVLQVGDGDF